MLLDTIGVKNKNKGYKIINHYGDKQICCDGIRFDIEFACKLLNEYNIKQMELQSTINEQDKKINHLKQKKERI